MKDASYSRRTRLGVRHLWWMVRLAVLGVAAAGSAQAQVPPFDNTMTTAALPVFQFQQRALHQPPALDGTTVKAAKASAVAFVAWAGASVLQERNDGRWAIQNASGNILVARALGHMAVKYRKKDHTKALLVLSILGEMQSTEGAKTLRKFVKMKLPTKGPLDWETNENLAATALAELQAKAIDGLAYLPNGEGDVDVLNAIGHHPSRIVRAEAIEAYLWNHGDTTEARQIVMNTVQPGEAIFLNRIRREDGESAATFDPKIDTLLSQHPELVPPDPIRQDPQPPTTYIVSDQPPSDGFNFAAVCGTSYPTCGGTCPQGEYCSHSFEPEGCRCFAS